MQQMLTQHCTFSFTLWPICSPAYLTSDRVLFVNAVIEEFLHIGTPTYSYPSFERENAIVERTNKEE
jgi:hypothetical protein